MIPDEDVIEDVLEEAAEVGVGDDSCRLVRLEVFEAVVAELALLSLIDSL